MDSKGILLILIIFLLLSGCIKQNFVPVSGISLSQVWDINETSGFVELINEEFNRTIRINHLNISNSTTFSLLNGTGNDYACLNSNGTLFRSNTTC